MPLTSEHTYYASDVVGISSSAHVIFEGGAINVSLPASVTGYDEAHLIYVPEDLKGDVTIEETEVFPILCVGDTMGVGSTKNLTIGVNVRPSVVRVRDNVSYEFLIEPQYLYAVVGVAYRTHYWILGAGQQAAEGWAKEDIPQRSWTKE